MTPPKPIAEVIEEAILRLFNLGCDYQSLLEGQTYSPAKSCKEEAERIHANLTTAAEQSATRETMLLNATQAVKEAEKQLQEETAKVEKLDRQLADSNTNRETLRLWNEKQRQDIEALRAALTEVEYVATQAMSAWSREHDTTVGSLIQQIRERCKRVGKPTPPPSVPDEVEVPRCWKCGYSYEDCLIHMDHRLCGEPDPPSAANLAGKGE